MADQRIRILNYSLSLAQGLKPVATLKIEINGEAYQESASGDGQYDAFVRALRKIYTDLAAFPMLTIIPFLYHRRTDRCLCADYH